MALSLAPQPILHPIRPALVLMRALTDVEPPRERERPLLDFAWLLDRGSPFTGATCSIRFEIANLDDIALLGGPEAARHASATIAQRLNKGIDGPHRPRQVCERRFVLALPLRLQHGVELARVVTHAITGPIVFEKHCIQVAIGSHVAAFGRRETVAALAEAA